MTLTSMSFLIREFLTISDIEREIGLKTRFEKKA